jgi:hypothetical protein
MHKTANFGHLLRQEAPIKVEEEAAANEEQEVKVSQKYLDIINE